MSFCKIHVHAVLIVVFHMFITAVPSWTSLFVVKENLSPVNIISSLDKSQTQDTVIWTCWEENNINTKQYACDKMSHCVPTS